MYSCSAYVAASCWRRSASTSASCFARIFARCAACCGAPATTEPTAWRATRATRRPRRSARAAAAQSRLEPRLPAAARRGSCGRRERVAVRRQVLEPQPAGRRAAAGRRQAVVAQLQRRERGERRERVGGIERIVLQVEHLEVAERVEPEQFFRRLPDAAGATASAASMPASDSRSLSERGGGASGRAARATRARRAGCSPARACAPLRRQALPVDGDDVVEHASSERSSGTPSKLAGQPRVVRAPSGGRTGRRRRPRGRGRRGRRRRRRRAPRAARLLHRNRWVVVVARRGRRPAPGSPAAGTCAGRARGRWRCASAPMRLV